MLAFYTIVN